MKRWQIIERVMRLAKGHWGHKGRKGKVGGSLPKGGGSLLTDKFYTEMGDLDSIIENAIGETVEVKAFGHREPITFKAKILSARSSSDFFVKPLDGGASINCGAAWAREERETGETYTDYFGRTGQRTEVGYKISVTTASMSSYVKASAKEIRASIDG